MAIVDELVTRYRLEGYEAPKAPVYREYVTEHATISMQDVIGEKVVLSRDVANFRVDSEPILRCVHSFVVTCVAGGKVVTRFTAIEREDSIAILDSLEARGLIRRVESDY